jgi:hypothetical protein
LNQVEYEAETERISLDFVLMDIHHSLKDDAYRWFFPKRNQFVPLKNQNPEKTKTFAPALVKSVLASFYIARLYSRILSNGVGWGFLYGQTYKIRELNKKLMEIKKGGIKVFIAAHVQTSSYHTPNLST